MKKISVRHLGNGHNSWLRCLDFYRKQLDQMKDRLTDIIPRITDKDVAAAILDYKAGFRKHEEAIEQLQRDIRSHVAVLQREIAASDSDSIDAVLKMQYDHLKSTFKTQEKHFNRFRRAFTRFSAPWVFYCAD